MSVRINEAWKVLLKEEFEKDYFKNLQSFVKQEYATQRCYPPGAKIFAAFDHCPIHEIKVVIIGQDPYHGPGQANGLCFSVSEGVPFPPSLVNILKEVSDDTGQPMPTSGNLERWADQGVFLLNATLTVRAHQAGSHQGKGWEQFTDEVIRIISGECNNVIFLLWGGFAKKKEQLIDKTKHFVLKSGHPSPLSANRGLWFGNKHFTKANEYLKKVNKSPIKW